MKISTQIQIGDQTTLGDHLFVWTKWHWRHHGSLEIECQKIHNRFDP